MTEQVQEQPQEQAPPPVEEIEIIEAPEEEIQLETQEAPVEEKKPFDPKTDKVEFNTPEQQEKFNYIYKQAKMSDARNAMLTDMLQQATKRLEDVESRFKKTDETDAERVLFAKVKAARDAGDDAAEIAAIGELAEFKASKLAAPKPQPAVPVEQTQEFTYIANMVNERDSTGNIARPWLNESHPEFDSTIETLKSIAQKYVGDPLIIPKSLSELDNIMRQKMTQKPPIQTRAPNPMQGGNLTNVNHKPTIKLTRAELDVARKLGIDPKRYAAKRDEIAKSKS